MNEFNKILVLPPSQNIEKDLPEKVVVSSKSEIFKLADVDIIVGTWVCDPSKRNHLVFSDGNPLLAREVHYRYSKIMWKAGEGWPWYYVPAPLQYKEERDLYPQFEHHCIVWEFGGKVTTTKNMEGGDRGDRVSEVFVLVNDDQYGDNKGSFVVQVMAYAQE